ncbi:hypothetical protein [Billgrantia saliphila]|uniref:hypothetical protein n=1 Tax=Billgrantia saliphila TaxID=1848458 RepID=UPI000CE3E9C9|nr:hypothetical protein [Halomonas saliphila]
MFRTLGSTARRGLAALLLAAISGLALAERIPATPELTPFNASYRLEVKGWPNATIDHRLSRENGHWQSRMQAAIAVARGNERSRFIVTPEGIRSVNYASGYSVLGVSGRYRLGGGDLTRHVDRQAALIELSRRALAGGCEDAVCRLTYQDHRGREEALDYRVLARETLRLPSGEFEALKVEVKDPESPDSTLLFHFHPELPGLLLAVDYQSDGERRSRLFLTALDAPGR